MNTPRSVVIEIGVVSYLTKAKFLLVYVKLLD